MWACAFEIDCVVYACFVFALALSLLICFENAAKLKFRSAVDKQDQAIVRRTILDDEKYMQKY